MKTAIVIALVTLLVFVDCQQQCGRNNATCGEDECCVGLFRRRCAPIAENGENCRISRCCRPGFICRGILFPRCVRAFSINDEAEATEVPTTMLPETNATATP